MKKFKFFVLAFVAFLSLSISVKAATLPKLFVTIRDYSVNQQLSKSELSEYDVLEVQKGSKVQLKTLKAHGNDMPTAEVPAGWYVDEINLQGVTWTSNDNNIATVDSNGLVTTIGEGQVSITATYNDEAADFIIKVGDVAPLEQVKENPETKTEEPIETIGSTEEQTVTSTETKEEIKTDDVKEDKGCKLEVYEIVIIACSVVLLIALITVLVLNKKKTKKETL